MPTKAIRTPTAEPVGISNVKRQRAKDPHVKQYALVLTHAVDTFGSRWKADAWLNRPNHIFGHRSPLQVLTLDPLSVEEELVRIEHAWLVDLHLPPATNGPRRASKSA
jgi:hypothetical protein